MEKSTRRTRFRNTGAPNVPDDTIVSSRVARRHQAKEEVPVYGQEYADDLPMDGLDSAVDFAETEFDHAVPDFDGYDGPYGDPNRVSDAVQALDDDGMPMSHAGTGKSHRFVKPQRFHFDPVRRHMDDADSPNPGPLRKWPLYMAVAATTILVFVAINVEQNREAADHWAAPESTSINESLVSREVMNPSADLPTRVPQAYLADQAAAFSVNEELPTPTPFVTEPPLVYTPAPTKMPLLKKGMQGDFIRTVQERLAALNYLSADQVDGKYGASTVAAVKEFQTISYIGTKPDGIVGSETYDSLMSENAIVAPTPIPRLNEPYVWATTNGTYYHSKADCSNMKGATEMPISEAKFQKKKACNRCDPPQ